MTEGGEKHMHRIVALFCFVVLFLTVISTNDMGGVFAYANGQSPVAEPTRKQKPSPPKSDTKKKATPAPAKKNAPRPVARPSQPTNGWRAGQRLVEEGDYRTAISFLKRYIRANPPSADAWYWLSRAHHAVGDYDRAQDAANVALQINPTYPALTKTPSGLQPMPPAGTLEARTPPPSVSVLPIKPVLPARIVLTPVPLSLPFLNRSEDRALSDDNGNTRGVLTHIPYPPLQRGRSVVWMQQPAFQEISRWRHQVDRVGILASPRLPVAFRGTRPSVLFIWTGDQWVRVKGERMVKRRRMEDARSSLGAVKEELHDLANHTGFYWDESDTPALASQAAHWRFAWAGDIYVKVTLLEPVDEQQEQEPTQAAMRTRNTRYVLEEQRSPKTTQAERSRPSSRDITGPGFMQAEEDRIYQETIEWIPNRPPLAEQNDSVDEQDAIPANKLVFEEEN